MKKKPLSIQQHFSIALELHNTKTFLRGLCVFISEHYPKNSAVVKEGLKAYQSVCDLISEFDNNLFRDNPGIPTEAAGVYYPGKDLSYDEVKAKELTTELQANAEIGEIVSQKDEAIQRTLIEAFKKFNVETIRQGYGMYLSKVVKEKACTCER